jgi:DeoR/GlpR family transcriptional regulator of sugar metabolism
MYVHEHAHSGTTVIELPDERRRRILEAIERDGKVFAADLATAYTTSEDTIRRDLRELDRAGLLRRVHGGAVRAAKAELPFRERVTADPKRKAAIAATACQLVKANEVVLIDAGSTNLRIACALPDGHAAAIVTNSPEIAVAIGSLRRTEVVLLGGTMHPGSGWVGGARTLRQIEELRPDLCLLGVCSVDAQDGICASSAEEAALKQSMARVSTRVAAAILRERMVSRGAFRVVPLSAVDHLVVEADAPPEMLRQIRALDEAPEILIASAVEG